ncbi:MAG: DUF2498 family protein [Aeromonadaceae bacterium]|nr:DUF2498 family protein [Aeromonadaceae bacterium]
MVNNRQPIDKVSLLAKANQLIQAHQDYQEGMQASDVEQKADVLVFKGDYFLDENGLPTPRTTVVFNIFKQLATQLSKEYHLD